MLTNSSGEFRPDATNGGAESSGANGSPTDQTGAHVAPASDNPSPLRSREIVETESEFVKDSDDATPERVAAYDLDLSDLKRELRAYVKAPAKPKARVEPLPATRLAPAPRRAPERVCDALVIFITPEICQSCGSMNLTHFVGIRRPIRNGRAYLAYDPNSAASAAATGLPILRRFQREVYVPLCSHCCGHFPIEDGLDIPFEVNHLSRSDSQTDLEMFTQPHRALRAEETPDEPSNDQ